MEMNDETRDDGVVIGLWAGLWKRTTDATEVNLETFGMLSQGMTEPEVVGRTGQPDRRIDQFEPTPLSQRLVSYQYIWNGDTSKGEWTTTVTFSANTNKAVRIDRERK